LRKKVIFFTSKEDRLVLQKIYKLESKQLSKLDSETIKFIRPQLSEKWRRLIIIVIKSINL
jgi:hypothetical protein